MGKHGQRGHHLAELYRKIVNSPSDVWDAVEGGVYGVV